MKLIVLIIISLTTLDYISSLPVEQHQDVDNSDINKIVIPYAPYTTELVKNSKGKIQKVYVPLKIDVVPQINLKEGEIAMGTQKGMALNLAEGAYPVYYMPGNVNGKFHDKKIYVLE